MNVPLFSVAGWSCTFEGDRHVFSKSGSKIVVRSNGLSPTANRDLVPRGATVERTRLRQLLPHAITGWGNNTNGNDQGGQGIDLQPVLAPDTQAALDGTIERHPVCLFNADGTPKGRERLGYTFEYTPANDTPREERIMWYAVNLSSSLVQSGWQRIDPAHLCRAFNPAVVLWREKRDPVAFWWLQVVANDVMIEYADKPLQVGGDPWGLADILERTRTVAKGTAWFGELRHHAHSLRAVVEAHRALGNHDEGRDLYAQQRAWLVDFVEMVHNVQAPNGAMTMNDIYSGQDQRAPWTVDQYWRTPGRGIDGMSILSPDETECVSWQAPYMIRALYEAHAVLRDPETSRRVRDIVAKWMRVWHTCELLTSEYDTSRYTLPKYLVVKRGLKYLDTLNEGIGRGLSQWDDDSFQVARALGIRT